MAVPQGVASSTALVDCLLVAGLGVVGVGLDAEAPESGGQLPGGQSGGLLQELVDDRPGDVAIEVGGVLEDHPGPAGVDGPGCQQTPQAGEPVLEIGCDGELGFGGPAGETQRGADLGGGGVVGQRRVVVEVPVGVGERGEVPVQLRLVVGDHPLVGSQHHHPVVARQAPAVGR